MKNLKTILLLLLIVGLTSCEDFFITEIDPPKQAVEKQLVVHSYLCPDFENVYVSVKYSKPIFGDNYNDLIATPVENATVKITSQKTNQTVSIPFDKQNGSYIVNTKDFPLKEGETYLLSVSDVLGNKVNASCTIPEAIKTSIRNIKLTQTSEEGYKYFQASFDIDDVPGQKNYYKAFAVIKYLLKNYNDSYSEGEFSQEFLFSDLNNDGKTIHAKAMSEYGMRFDKIKSIKVTLYSIDENYYNYQKTINMQENLGENPFAEPVVIVSNINNGLGVFGAYTVKIEEKVF